jgi:hypothetical protein
MNGNPLYQGDSVTWESTTYFIVSITFDGLLVLSLDGTRNETVFVSPELVTSNWS